MTEPIDPVTGGTVKREREMYIRYHGLTAQQADLVMAQTTRQNRDLVFALIIGAKVLM